MKKWMEDNIRVFFACVFTIAIIIFRVVREGFSEVFNPNFTVGFFTILTVAVYFGKNKKL